jgi:hypothetical protein
MNSVTAAFSIPTKVAPRRSGWLIVTLFLAGTPALTGQGGSPAISYLPPIGGAGGGQFSESCGPGRYLTGLDLHVADDVDAIRSICSGTNLQATGIGDAISNPASVSVSSPVLSFHGGPGGKPLQLSCPPATPVVLGMDVAAEGVSTIVVNNIHLFCGLPVANQRIPAYPSAVFDGPMAHATKGLIPGSAPKRLVDHQACPAGQIGVGINGRSGVWLDAVGLICGPPPAARVAPIEPPKVVGRLTMPDALTPPGSVCATAATAAQRKSPAALPLEAQCNQLKTLIVANEKRDLTPGPSGTPVAVCDAAQTALDHNAPEAFDLSSKCRATGGGQNLTSQADQFAFAGQTMAAADSLLAELRKRQPPGDTLSGFDTGVGVAGNQAVWGPGKQKVLDSLPPTKQDGFKIAVSFVLDRNRNAELATLGATIAAGDPVVNAARSQNPDVRYWLGFDIASGLYGDPALGGKGHTSAGPGSDAIRNGLSAPAQKGFNAGMQFHLSRK